MPSEVCPSHPRLGPRGRLLAAGISLAAATPLGLAAALSRAAEGIGTHRGLGLPACGWQSTMSLPCPSCGMTTAFSHAVRGDLLTAGWTQPAGLMICLVTAMTVIGGFYAAVTGAPLQHLLVSVAQPRILWLVIAILVGSWIFKVVGAIS